MQSEPELSLLIGLISMAVEFDPLSSVMAAHAAIHVLLCLPQNRVR
jgi:hypothetical protein